MTVYWMVWGMVWGVLAMILVPAMYYLDDDED